MDFHSLGRRELQALCKKNKIPANITNVAMADALTALDFVEGIEEFLNHSESETVHSSVELPQEVEMTSPCLFPTAPRTSRRRATKEDSIASETLTATRRSTRRIPLREAIEAKKNLMETPSGPSQRMKIAESTGPKMEPLLKEEEEKNGNYVEKAKIVVLETPAAMPASHKRVAKEKTTMEPAYSTRRSARLAGKCVQMSNRDKEIPQTITFDSFIAERDQKDEASEQLSILSKRRSGFEDTEEERRNVAMLVPNVEGGTSVTAAADDLEVIAGLNCGKSDEPAPHSVENLDKPSEINTKVDQDTVEADLMETAELGNGISYGLCEYSAESLGAPPKMKNDSEEQTVQTEELMGKPDRREASLETSENIEHGKGIESGYLAADGRELEVLEIKGYDDLAIEKVLSRNENKILTVEELDTNKVVGIEILEPMTTDKLWSNEGRVHLANRQEVAPESHDHLALTELLEKENEPNTCISEGATDTWNLAVLDAANRLESCLSLSEQIRPNCLTPAERSSSETPKKEFVSKTPATSTKLAHVSDDKENIDGSGRKVVAFSEMKLKKKGNEMAGGNDKKALHDLSLRQLQKMFKEKLVIAKGQNDTAVPSRPVLQALPNNRPF